MLFGSVFMFRDPGLSTPYDQLVREMREYVLMMEELGFDYLWLGEHHLGLEGFGNSPNPLYGRRGHGEPYKEHEVSGLPAWSRRSGIR